MRRSKFKAYYKLNLGLISPMAYVLSLILGVGSCLLPGERDFGLTIIIIWAVCMKDIMKVCSATLYQKEAYFYQSFPVTPFQTVLAKTLVCAQLMSIGPWVFAVTKVITTGTLFDPEKSGFAGGFPAMPSGVVGLMWLAALAAFSMTAAGVVLMGLHLGNGFRNHRKGRPGSAATVIFMGVMFAALLSALPQMFFKVPDNMPIVALGTAALMLMSILLLWLNARALRKYYSV